MPSDLCLALLKTALSHDESTARFDCKTCLLSLNGAACCPSGSCHGTVFIASAGHTDTVPPSLQSMHYHCLYVLCTLLTVHASESLWFELNAMLVD